MSVNACWRGRRFKTAAYDNYEATLLYLLPKIEIPDGNLALKIRVGYSNKNNDIDNFLKPFIDVLQKKYGFNDSHIYELEAEKVIVKKGDEFIEFEIGLWQSLAW